MQGEHLSNYTTSSMLLQEHAKHFLSLMDKTDASRNALDYFEWCQEVEDFTENSTGTNNFQGQSVARRSDGSFTGNTQEFNYSQNKQRQIKCDNETCLETKKNGSTDSSIYHSSGFDTSSSSVPTSDSLYNNEKGAFKEEAYLKRPDESSRNHTDFYSSSCGSSTCLPPGKRRKEGVYPLNSSPYKSTSHRVSFDSTFSSSLGSSEYKKSDENWCPAGNDVIDERLINYYQQEPAMYLHQTSNSPRTVDHSSHHSITSALNDLCDHGDFSLQNME